MNNLYFKRVIRTSALLFSGVLMSFNSVSYSQSITLKGNKIPFSQVVNAIRQQSGYSVFSPKALLDEVGFVSIDAQNMPLDDFLKTVLANKAITYQVEDRTISLSKKNTKVPTSTPSVSTVEIKQQQRTITGKVTNEDSRQPILGVTVKLKGQPNGILTDLKGQFTLLIPQDVANPVLVFSHVGYKTVEIAVKGQNTYNVSLESEVESIKETVVTGIYQRTKESFTGSSSTYTAKELKMIGNQGILQSLRTLDPSFAIVENNQFGSDPNRLPDIEIRGKSSVIGLTEQFSSNPNQPLFILDGFESSLAVISDFSMDRIESITILKDAAAAAIYGSKAANGVIVVESKRPTQGQLRLTYNLNSSVSFADLKDYNLMNASEKLEYEKLSLFYGGLDAFGNITGDENEAKYFHRKKEVERGVNTYWLNEPLRTALSQNHNIFAEGGDANLRYSASLNYGDTKGVMKQSSRKVTSGSVRLIYRKDRLSFSNSLNVDYVAANRESIPFARFSRANPYHRMYNEQGGIDKVMENIRYLDLATFTSKSLNIYNPLYDMNNNNVNKTSTQGFTNNFEIDWRILDELRFRTRIGLRHGSERVESFLSPFNSEFDGVNELQRGRYDEQNGKRTNYDGDLSLTYGKLLKEKHLLNLVAGMRMEQGSSLFSGYGVRGFVDDEFTNPSFALGYEPGGRAGYQESKRRSASFFFNTGYSYDNKYLIDATVRSDGSSVYGADRQFTTIWSTGLAWNMHNESFIKETSFNWINFLKIRASIGNPGNQNFNDYISMRVYRYNSENRTPFGSSVILSNFGNSNLKWQKTLDRNIGFDLEVLDKRLRFNFDYFNKNTDPLLVFIGLPSSTGATSKAENLGSQVTKGMTLITDYTIIRKQDFNWRINLNMRQLRSKYENIGDALNKFNQDNKSRNLVRYYDGARPSDLWAVRSAGIDPATGREIFLTKEGKQTFVHNYDDEVVVGNSEPKLEGILGTSFYYKGFSGSVFLRYRLGGQTFMQTLYEKVENVNIQNIALNQDKRALYDRWKKPGDVTKFRAISQTDFTPMSSRFVADNNIISGESFSFGYETSNKAWLRRIGASSITTRAYMNDIFRISSIKNERGIDYPFARSVSFSLGLRF